MPNISKSKRRAPKKGKVVLIDRDGVINEDLIGDYVKRWEEFRFVPGALAALKQLHDSGFQIVIISNQAGIGDGVFTEAELAGVTQNMLEECKQKGIDIRKVYYCMHGKEAGCDCRKPKTGLLKQAAHDLNFDPPDTYFIGDKLADMQAGKAFKLKTLFVRTGHGKTDEAKLSTHYRPEAVFPSIAEAADYIVARSR